MKIKAIFTSIAIAASGAALADPVVCHREAMAAGTAPAACAPITRAMLGAAFESVTIDSNKLDRLPYEIGDWTACYHRTNRKACEPLKGGVLPGQKAVFSAELARQVEAFALGASDSPPSLSPRWQTYFAGDKTTCYREAMAAGTAPAVCQRVLPFLLGEMFESVEIDPESNARLPASLNGFNACASDMNTLRCESITKFNEGILSFVVVSDSQLAELNRALAQQFALAPAVSASCDENDICEISDPAGLLNK